MTGQVVRIDHAWGIARIVNAGHPLPILMRDGHAEDVDLAPDFPFGIAVDADIGSRNWSCRPETGSCS